MNAPCLALALLLALPFAACTDAAAPPPVKTSTINADTPEPTRFIVRGRTLVDLQQPDKPLFFRGMGYSPFLPGETPMYGVPPANDNRYPEHLRLLKEMGVNYIHVFPRLLPANFFAALDKTDLVYLDDAYPTNGYRVMLSTGTSFLPPQNWGAYDAINN